MIELALKAYGGQATYKEITDYIGKNFQQDIKERKTWKNSVGGVLSSNPMFQSTALDLSEAKRGKGGIWKIVPVEKGKRKATPSEPATPTGASSLKAPLEELPFDSKESTEENVEDWDV